MPIIEERKLHNNNFFEDTSTMFGDIGIVGYEDKIVHYEEL